MCNPDKTLKTKLSLFRIGFLKTHTNNPHNELKINFLSYKKNRKSRFEAQCGPHIDWGLKSPNTGQITLH